MGDMQGFLLLRPKNVELTTERYEIKIKKIN